ncbi:MAG: sigma-70 family RNA polymerase sigma factor [Candidatus Aerophobetes bacterium]|nr:sigma-70 family RNA polymerase sigma factor [Candidatus Aerophobetes bacterium]
MRVYTDKKREKMLDPDAHLMLEFKNGDISSSEKLLQKYKERVINIIYQFIGDKNKAEDLAIEVFLRVYRAAKRYEAKAKFATWLYKITTNLCLNEIRKKRRLSTISLNKPVLTEEGEEEKLIDRIAGPFPSSQEILEEKEKEALIRKTISSLPTKQRIAIILQIYEELSYKEISKILGCSIKSVERRLYRARTNLKEKLSSCLKAGKK